MLFTCAYSPFPMPVSFVVPLGPGAVSASEVLPRHQRPDVVLLSADEAAPLQFRMDTLIDLCAGAIVGRNHQRVPRRFCILLRNSGDALIVALNLMDSALPVKVLYCRADFTPRKLLDHLF